MGAPLPPDAGPAHPSDDLHPIHDAHGAQRDPHPLYDFVSLLIGVNNEYRGRSTAEYAEEFGQLLQQAIRFARGQAANTLVLSIPDWSVTPFARASLPAKQVRDQAIVAGALDAFNA